MTGLDDKGCLTEIGPTLPDNAPIEGHCMVIFMLILDIYYFL